MSRSVPRLTPDAPQTVEARQKVLLIARDFLAGEFGVVEAARRIVAWQKKGKLRDSDGMVFAGIAEETDHLPDGVNGERLLYEDRYRQAARDAAFRLLKRYG